VTRNYSINQWLWGSLDWLFPPVCGGCGIAGFRWCPDCRQKVQGVPEPYCTACGLPLTHPGLCPTCIQYHPKYQALRSWLVFEGPIRRALHTLKYRRNMALGEALAADMSDFIRKLDWPVEVVVPVPLGRERQKERGYNQVGLVALPLAARLGWSYQPKGLSRTRETRSQVGLSAQARRENVAAAFQADLKSTAGRTILLMDDVATTGATLASCAEALLETGAKSVFALTIARALPHHGLKVA
jgi:competence protein ComFC